MVSTLFAACVTIVSRGDLARVGRCQPKWLSPMGLQGKPIFMCFQ